MERNIKSYSNTFKQKVVREAFSSTEEAKDIAAKYEISPSTLSEWKKEALSDNDSKRVKQLDKQLEEVNVKNIRKLNFVHFNSRIEPGVEKKIEAQISEFQNAGININEVCVLRKKDKHTLLDRIRNNLLFFYRNKYFYEDAIDNIENEGYVYLRRNTADKYYVEFLRKLKEKNCKILVELPTYPYFKDDFSKVKHWSAYFKERAAIPKFKDYVDRFVTYSNDKEIFGVPTIKVKNGIYVDKIEARKPALNSASINLLAVATFRKHHGYERVINGIANYYANGGKRNIILRMVGEGDEKQKYVKLVNKLNLQKHVLFLGKMVGDELSEQYDLADIALGSFGMFKIDVFNSSVLKVREYLAKGLPIVSGCHEDAFEEVPFKYYLEFTNDKSTVDIHKVVEFYNQIYPSETQTEREIMVAEIRNYARKQVNYDNVFKNVIDYLQEE